MWVSNCAENEASMTTRSLLTRNLVVLLSAEIAERLLIAKTRMETWDD